MRRAASARDACHHNLEEYLSAYLDGCALRERKGPLFRTIARGTKRLSDALLPQANAFKMVRRRAVAAEIETAIGKLVPSDRDHGIFEERWHAGESRRNG